jgi:formylglycine-generating enzyme required for sulfatase activity
MATNDGDGAGRPGNSGPHAPPLAAGEGRAGADTQRGGETAPAGRPPGALPEAFGPYRIKRRLGAGGMGTVYLAENTELQREEALKVPHFEADDDPQARERFLREARAAARLEHPNLCQVYHVGVQDGVCFLTMRYLPGQPLSELAVKPQPPRKAVEIVAKLAQALEYAHGKGVIHRDLKPSNVMMCTGLGPVVLDFGLAKQLRQTDQKLTRSGTSLGTPTYMPPEQVQGESERMGPASDVYSLGVILYELLTGHLPFAAPNLMALFYQILHTPPPPPSARQAGVSPVLDAICRQALAKAPEQRYATMKAFGAALVDSLRAGPATVSPGKSAPGKAAPAGSCQAPAVVPAQARAPVGLPRGTTAASPPRERTGTSPGTVRPAPLDCTGAGGVSAAAVRQAQAAWAQYLGRSVEEEDEVAPGVTMAFVLVPPGKFLMGSPEGERGRAKDEVPHPVEITRPFYLGKYAVTQAQYEALVGKHQHRSAFRGADLPVESVNWDEASAYADTLTKRRGDGLVYRLPSEAEWEHACRGGRPSAQPFGVGDGTSLSSDQANFDGNYPYGGAGKGVYLQKTCRVGSYPPNALGLHDLHGNVWEWCADRYGPYPAGNATDPTGPAKGPSRVLRGGGWDYYARDCRAARRLEFGPGTRFFYLGFRLARATR